MYSKTASPESKRIRANNVALKNAHDVINSEVEKYGLLLDNGTLPKPGDLAPDFNLPDSYGSVVDLYSALKNGPVILVFFRGGWCPYCDLYLRKLQHSHDQLEKLGAQIIAISPQIPSRSMGTALRSDIRFPLLHDRGNKTGLDYGVAVKVSSQLLDLYASAGVLLDSYNDRESSNTLPLPSTFIVGTDKLLRLVSVEADYTRRIEPDVLVECIKDMIRTESDSRLRKSVCP